MSIIPRAGRSGGHRAVLHARQSVRDTQPPGMIPFFTQQMAIRRKPPPLEKSYTGEEKLSKLPPELRLRIITHLQAPDDERWDDKTDLQALHLVGNKALSEVVRLQLFRFMTLRYSYDYDRKSNQCRKPRLMQLMEQYPNMRDLLKQCTKAIRLIILPIAELAEPYHDLDAVFRTQPFLLWSEHLRHRLGEWCCSAPCVYTATTASIAHFMNHNPPVKTFETLFGRTETEDGQRIEEDISAPGKGSRDIREVFASYIDRSMHDLFSHLTSLRHVEAGMISPEDRWTVEAEYNYTAGYGLLFATAMLLKRLPEKVNSIRTHGFPHDYSNPDAILGYSPEASWFLVNYALTQLRQHATLLKSLDLDVACFARDPFPYGTNSRWRSAVPYYAELLHSLPNLTRLRLTCAIPQAQKKHVHGVFLRKLLKAIKMPNITSLILTHWTTVASTIMMLPSSFEELEDLTLNRLVIRSSADDVWSSTL